MAGIILVGLAAESVTVQVTANGGETAWQVEVNRSADFSSDESIFLAVAAAGVNVVIPDLIPATRYYLRSRRTNAGNGNWSATLFAGTLQPAAPANPPYLGYSLIPALLCVPEPLGSLVATNVEAGSLVSNLTNDDPMSTFRIAGAGTAITFQTMGQGIDTFAILGSLANESVTWRIRGDPGAGNLTIAPAVDTGVIPFRTGTGIGRRAHYHAFRRLTQVYGLGIAPYFWRIDIGGVNSFFLARHLVVGLARDSVNISRGAGHAPADLGRVERTLFGGPDRVRGWRGRAVEFPISWIREAEYEAKWRDLDTLVGETEPVLALPNPKANLYLNDRIAYGTLADSRGVNERGDRYSKTLSINSLY